MKKKILIIIDTLKIGGGVERFTSLLTQGLSEKFDLFILTFEDSKKIYPFEGRYLSLKEKLNVSSGFLSLFFFKKLLNSIKIYKLIKSVKPDLILSFTIYTNIFTIFTKFLFQIKTPLIISIWCNPALVYKNKMPIINFLIKILYGLKTVDKVITVSNGIQYILESDYGIKKHKLKTIYTGIELEKIEKIKNEEISNYDGLFNNTDIIKFITVGRICEEKAHKYLIEAFSILKKKIPNSKLIIRGDGPLRDEIITLIKKLKLENDVIILGLKKNLYKYLAKSDIFVLSSKTEGLPTVLLEALACGVPVISTDCKTGPKEILDNGKYGILARVMDSEDLAKKMIYLAKNEELINTYSKLSLKRAEFFNISNSINQWIDLIKLFIKNNK